MLQLKNISKTFHSGIDDWTFGPVDFEVKAGGFVVILGKSGSGKSTLLHIAGGLATPNEGEVLWENQNLYQMKDNQLTEFRNQKMGFVFQDFYLLKQVDVFTNIAVPLMIQGGFSKTEIKTKVQHVLALTELTGLEKRFPHELSGGQKQRVAIARAFVHNSKIVFTDEPTGNLDEVSGKNVIELLEKLNKLEQTTILCVTHDEKIAEKAGQVVRIADGGIINLK